MASVENPICCTFFHMNMVRNCFAMIIQQFGKCHELLRKSIHFVLSISHYGVRSFKDHNFMSTKFHELSRNWYIFLKEDGTC